MRRRAKKTSPSRSDAILEWVRTATPSPGAGACGTCRHAEVAKIVQAVVNLRRRGVVTVSKQQLYRRLQQEFPDFQVAFTCLRDHIERHTGGGWGGKA